MLEINQIHHGDCLELMHEIPDGSVDMVLADLPYGTTKNAWDSIIPLEPLWKHYKRIVKPNGAIVLTAAQPFTTVLITAAGRKWFKWEDVWDKKMPVGFLNAKIMPLRQHENILVFGSGRVTYNPQMRIGKYRNKTPKRTVDNQIRSYGKVNHKGDNFNDTYYPTSICQFSNANQSEKSHTTQKPVALFAYLINTYSNPGDLILDNAAGSGTTAIAAIQTGRNWLCIEKDEDIYATAANRIAKALGQGFTPAARAGQPNNQNQAELLQRGLWE